MTGKRFPHPKPKYTAEQLQTLKEWSEAPRDLWGYPGQNQNPPENRSDRYTMLGGKVYCSNEKPESGWWRFSKPRDQARHPELRLGWGEEMRLCDAIDERRQLGPDTTSPNPKPEFKPPALPYIKPRPITE